MKQHSSTLVSILIALRFHNDRFIYLFGSVLEWTFSSLGCYYEQLGKSYASDFPHPKSVLLYLMQVKQVKHEAISQHAYNAL